MDNIKQDTGLNEELKLKWSPTGGCMNLVEWINNSMPAYCKQFTNIPAWMVEVIYQRSIPVELITPYVIRPDIDLSNALILQREKQAMKDHDDKMKTWRESRGYLISKIKESMSQASLQRVHDVHPIEYERAIKTDDVLEVLRLIEAAHMIRNKVASLGDKSLFLTEYHTFKRRHEDDLTAHKARFRNLLERGKALLVDAVADKTQVIYLYLSSLADYPVLNVRMRVIGHIANSHKPAEFPGDLEDLHNDLVALEQASKPSAGEGAKTLNILIGGEEYQLVRDGNYVNAVSLSDRLKNGDHNKKKDAAVSKQKDGKFNTNKFITRQMEKRKCTREEVVKELKCPICDALQDHIARDCPNKKARVNSTTTEPAAAGAAAAVTDDNKDGIDASGFTPQQWINLINFGKQLP